MWLPFLQPRHVPWLGLEPVTLWFGGQCSIHWATPARAENRHFYLDNLQVPLFRLNICRPELLFQPQPFCVNLFTKPFLVLFCVPFSPLGPQFPQPPKPVSSTSSMSLIPVLHPTATVSVRCLSIFLWMLGSCLSSQFFHFRGSHTLMSNHVLSQSAQTLLCYFLWICDQVCLSLLLTQP